MIEKIKKIISKMQKNPGATMLEVEKVELQLGVNFPKLYVSFLLDSNGADGVINESYLNLWSLDELVDSNKGYKVDEYAPNLILFGTDGGDMAYAFDRRFDHLPIVETPFIGMGLEETKLCGQTFLEFLEYISKQH